MIYDKPKPVDIKLYNKTKKFIYNKYPKHSAYRSGFIVKKYKKDFATKYGDNKSPYTGTKTRKFGLNRWFDEKWKNQRGKVGYKYKSDIYRPTKKINKYTPKTYNNLSNNDIKKARKTKYTKGRVYRF